MAGSNPNLAVFIGGVLLLLTFAYMVFRVIVRRYYRLHGHLTGWSSTLQLLAFAGLMAFLYLFNPPARTLSWMLAGSTFFQQQILVLVIILLGFLVAFGTMGWVGMRRKQNDPEGMLFMKIPDIILLSNFGEENVKPDREMRGLGYII